MAISNNADFLFLYEAIQCNPNGDPDQENKPRMDYDTQTNLVTDVRVKRYIRDFLKQEGHDIFVDMEGDSKVKMDQRLSSILAKVWDQEEEMKKLINNEELYKAYEKLKEKDADTTIKKLISKKADRKVNSAILSGLVREKYIDIRFFGSAFAVEGFNRAMTGPIQMNWGYSFNKVYLLDSDTISSIMNDDSSTFGKDYRVKYSLLGFHGSINKNASKTTGLTDADLELFRSSIWNSLSANPTRSKLNQYPKLYVEIIYNDGYYNGHFGDLRNYVSVETKDDLEDKKVRSLDDLSTNFSVLTQLLELETGPDKPIKAIHINRSPDLQNRFSYEGA